MEVAALGCTVCSEQITCTLWNYQTHPKHHHSILVVNPYWNSLKWLQWIRNISLAKVVQNKIVVKQILLKRSYSMLLKGFVILPNEGNSQYQSGPHWQQSRNLLKHHLTPYKSLYLIKKWFLKTLLNGVIWGYLI